MAAFTTRQWRSLGAVLLLMSLVAYVGVKRKDGRATLPLFYSTRDSVAHEEHQSDSSRPKIAFTVLKSMAEPTTPSTAALATLASLPASSANLKADATTMVTASLAPTAISKAVVMGALESEDTSWVAENMVGWQQAVYRVDVLSNETSPTGFSTKLNKGREAMPYLTYIIDHYDDLPDVIAFVHPHRSGYPQAWHNDVLGHDAVTMLNRLQLAFVVERGYVNLRCNTAVGCPDEVRPWREPPDLKRSQEHVFPYFYSVFFNRTLEQARKEIEVVAAACCAQFAVSREQVHKRSKAQYEKIRYVIDTTTYDDYTSGRVMEYMWHILFGMDFVHCPAANECYCNVYGMC